MVIRQSRTTNAVISRSSNKAWHRAYYMSRFGIIASFVVAVVLASSKSSTISHLMSNITKSLLRDEKHTDGDEGGQNATADSCHRCRACKLGWTSSHSHDGIAGSASGIAATSKLKTIQNWHLHRLILMVMLIPIFHVEEDIDVAVNATENLLA